MDPASDLAAKLVTLSPVGGVAFVLGTNLFTGREREEEVAGSFPRVTLLNYGGPAPQAYLGGQRDGFYRGRVQVRVRGAPEQFAAGETLARAILHGLNWATVTGYVDVRAEGSAAAYFGSDTSGRDVWTIDFQCGWTE